MKIIQRLVAIAAFLTAGAVAQAATVGKPAPLFSAVDTHGKTIHMAQLKVFP
ncbi:MAG: hypothetical protein ACREL1_07590 [bacterium]